MRTRRSISQRRTGPRDGLAGATARVPTTERFHELTIRLDCLQVSDGEILKALVGTCTSRDINRNLPNPRPKLREFLDFSHLGFECRNIEAGSVSALL